MAESITSPQGLDLLEPTSESSISVSAIVEDVPTLTVATIIGVTVVVLAAIAIVFVFGVLIDCRQQRLLEQKMGEVKKKKSKNHRRMNSHPEGDAAGIANTMEETSTTVAPAEVLRNIP